MLTRLVILGTLWLAVASCVGVTPKTWRLERSRFEPTSPSEVLGPWIEPGRFQRALVSWNAGPAARLTVDLRVAAGSEPSPWMRVATWPDAQPVGPAAPGFGRVDVDEFRASDGCWFDALQVRIGGDVGLLERVFVCVAGHPADVSEKTLERTRVIELQGLSQHAIPAPLGPRLCSPTSVAMALGAHGVDVSLERLAERSHDGEHDLYGNWLRAVAAAAELGVPACVTRLRSWREVAFWLERGVVVVASITVEPGDLPGAPYDSTAGHLLVVRGLDGGVCVADPAAPTADTVLRTYDRTAFERVWFQRKGGVAYLIGAAVTRDVPEPVEALDRFGE